MDFCPCHANEGPLELFHACAAAPTSDIPCRGIIVGPEDGRMCLVHMVLVDHWMGHAGGADVCRQLRADASARRERFRQWLASTPADDVVFILGLRHVPQARPR